MTARLTETALAELAAILAYLDARSPAGGRNVMASIQNTIHLIGEFPRRGRLAGESSVRVAAAGRYPYLIYWDLEADGAVVVHIRHASRQAWADREP